MTIRTNFILDTPYDQWVYYNTNPSADNIARVQAQIDEVKDVMIDNIDRVLERGERIELLVDKTELLTQNARKFEKSVWSLEL